MTATNSVVPPNATGLRQPTTAPVIKRWRVELVPDQAPLIVEAHGFRIEGGGLIFVRPAGCVAAFAPGCWRTIQGVD
jgi:hypothetical protein